MNIMRFMIVTSKTFSKKCRKTLLQSIWDHNSEDSKLKIQKRLHFFDIDLEKRTNSTCLKAEQSKFKSINQRKSQLYSWTNTHQKFR